MNKHRLIYKYGELVHSPSTSFAYIEPEVTFQMVGTDPCFIRLSVSFTWTARVKQSVSKCSEHSPKTGRVEVFLVLRDKSFPLRTDVTT